MATIADLNKRYGSSGVETTPFSGGKAFSIADLNTYNTQKTQDDEEERKRREQEGKQREIQKSQRVEIDGKSVPGGAISPDESQGKPVEGFFKKAARLLLPKSLEEKLLDQDPTVRETLLSHEDDRISYLRNQRAKENFKAAGVTQDMIENPDKYVPKGYEEPKGFFGQLREGIAFSYAATIRTLPGNLQESAGHDFSSGPDIVLQGEEAADKAAAYLMKNPQLYAPQDIKGFLDQVKTMDFDGRYYGRFIGETIPYVASIMAVSAATFAVTKNPVITGRTTWTSIFALEKARSFGQMRDEGIPADQAALGSTAYAAIAATVERGMGYDPSKLAVATMAKQTAYNTIKKQSVDTIKKVVGEGAEESIQQLSESLTAAWIDDSQQINWQEIVESFPAGVLASGPFVAVDLGTNALGGRSRRVEGENFIQQEEEPQVIEFGVLPEETTADTDKFARNADGKWKFQTETAIDVVEKNADGVETGYTKSVIYRTTRSGKQEIDVYLDAPDSPNAGQGSAPEGKVLLETLTLEDAQKKYQTTDSQILAQRIVNPHEGYNYQTEKYAVTPQDAPQQEASSEELLSAVVQQYDTPEAFIEAVRKGEIPPEYLKGIQDEDPMEARKYKSAEEFVKAQGVKVYRGINESSNAPKKWSLQYFADNPKTAMEYGTEYTENTIYPQKLADFTKPTPELTAILNKAIPELTPKQIETLRTTKPTGNAFATHFHDLIEKPFLQEDLQKAGYDVVKYPDMSNDLIPHDTYATLPNYAGESGKYGFQGNKKVESQLTDIYNQAHANIAKLPESKPSEVEKQAIKDSTSRVFERLQQEHPQSLEGDLQYSKMNMKKDAEKAVNLVAKDVQKAYDIAMGNETSTDVTSTAVSIALSEKAMVDGNYELYEKLTRNRSLAQTRRGQEIVAEKGSVTDNSTSRYVKDLISAKLEALGNKYLDNIKIGKNTSPKERALKALDAEVKKTEKYVKSKKLTTKDAISLLDTLTCL